MKDLITIIPEMKKIKGFSVGMGQLEKLLSIEAIDYDTFEIEFVRGAGLTNTTYRNIRSAVKQFFEWTKIRNDGVILNPLKVKPKHLDLYFDFELKRNSAITVQCRQSQLKTFFREMQKKIPGWKSPFEYMEEKLRVKLLKIKGGSNKRNYLKLEELEKVLTYCRSKPTFSHQRLFVLIQILSHSGLRISELLNCHWKDVEVQSDKALLNIIGKGGYHDVQPVSLKCIEDAKALFKVIFEREPQPNDPLITTLGCMRRDLNGNGDISLSSPRIWQALQALAKELNSENVLGRKVKLHPHVFRHSYAMALKKLGYNVRDIKDLLRHRSLETTDTYLRHEDADPGKLFETFEK